MYTSDAIYNLSHIFIHYKAGKRESFLTCNTILLHHQLYHFIQCLIRSLRQIFIKTKSDPSFRSPRARHINMEVWM